MSERPFLLRHLANVISAARLVAAPVLVVLALTQREALFATLLVFALVSDVADGLVARVFRLQSAIGAMLDSAADAAVLLAAVIGIFAFHADVWHQHRIACTLLAGAWLCVCVAAVLRYGKLSSFHTYASKAAGYGLGFFLGVLFLFGFVDWLFRAAVILGVASSLEELILVCLLPKWRADVRGIWWVFKRAGG